MDSQYRKADLTAALERLGLNRLDVLFTGVTGAGKSTTLNALFGGNHAKEGDGVDPETMNVTSYMFNEHLFIWDSPGLGDGVQRDLEHQKKLLDLLYKNYGEERYQWIDLVVVIIEGSNRDMGTTYKLLNDTIIPNFPSNKILVAINQADIAKSGRHWDADHHCPDPVLTGFLEDFAVSIQRRVKEATGANILKPIYYSAKYHYNINAFMDFILDNIPTQRDKIRIHPHFNFLSAARS